MSCQFVIERFFPGGCALPQQGAPTSIKWTTLETLSDAFLLHIHTTCGAQERKGGEVGDKKTVIAGLQVTVEGDLKQTIVRSV